MARITQDLDYRMRNTMVCKEFQSHQPAASNSANSRA
jgi:hypothetical protein